MLFIKLRPTSCFLYSLNLVQEINKKMFRHALWSVTGVENNNLNLLFITDRNEEKTGSDADG